MMNEGLFKIIIGLMLSSFIYSCSNTDRQRNVKKDSTEIVDPVIKQAPWQLVFDSAMNDMKIVEVRPIEKDSLQISTVTNFLNANYPDVQIEVIKISGDTVFTIIPESTYLTTQMGSAGADFYLKSATYLYTNLTGVHYVSYEFTEADHAVPGVYERADWPEW